MSPRVNEIESYLRGIAYPRIGDVAYPRLRPTDATRVPKEAWETLTVPVGVRLEMVGTAKAVDIAYQTTRGAEATFSVWRNGLQLDERKAVYGDGVARLSLGKGEPDNRAVIYLPEAMQPSVRSVFPLNGLLEPAPFQPRWLAIGDAVTQGWHASSPARSWPSIVGRKAGVDLVNFGFAGPGIGEILVGEHVAEQAAAAITISASTSTWDREPHTPGMVGQTMRALIGLIREGHPTTPIIVVSPLIRPEAEDTPNRLGATMADLRARVEGVANDLVRGGDVALTLVPGRDILGAGHLVDGVHPGDEGHTRIAARLAVVLYDVLQKGPAENVPQVERPDGGRPSAGTTFGSEFTQGGVPESADHGFVGDRHRDRTEGQG